MVGAILIAVEALTLHLICPGQGLDTQVDVSTAQVYGSNGTSAGATVSERRANAFEDQLEVEISNETARVRLPRRIVPPIHGGKDGWYTVKDLRVGSEAIEAKVPINFTNAPRMRISRVTGAVSVDGRDGSFSGTCHPYDPETVKRAF